LLVATAIVLGSEIGTTLKLFLASAKGPAIKKRVAMGNFLFNLVTVCLIFLLLRPLNHFISDVFQISDNLIALVFFQSLVNLFCVIIFYPFLHVFGKFLTTRFAEGEDESFFISKEPVQDTELALESLDKETGYFIGDVINYSLDSFSLKSNAGIRNQTHQSFKHKSISEKYDFIKRLYGEMHGFSLKLHNATSDKLQTERLDQLIAAMRNTIYAVKNIRDSEHDIAQIRNSSNDIKFSFYIQSGEKLLNFSLHISEILNEKDKKICFEKLKATFNSVRAGYMETIQLLYKENLAKHVSEVEISTLINFNRALYTYSKSLLFAIKDYQLDIKEAEYFEALPGFIR
jgi:phosphate:Na+ symporter